MAFGHWHDAICDGWAGCRFLQNHDRRYAHSLKDRNAGAAAEASTTLLNQIQGVKQPQAVFDQVDDADRALATKPLITILVQIISSCARTCKTK